MNRLKDYLLAMESNDSTYQKLYEGEMLDPEPVVPQTVSDSDYWDRDGEIAYHIDRPHKLSLDRPVITVKIPAYLLGFSEVSEAVCDYCLRAFIPYLEELNANLYNRSRPDKENGKYDFFRPGGKVLPRNGAYFKMCNAKYYHYRGMQGGRALMAYDDHSPGGTKPERLCLCLKLQVQLPYRKHKKAIQMLTRDLPQAVDSYIAGFDFAGLEKALSTAALQRGIRSWLRTSEYCAFVANGSLLPRQGGTDLPFPDAIPFQSPPEDEIEIMGVRGMGIRKGVTVITGGGYSGKSTLLDALSDGICNHIPGDGRELVITDETAVKISAEDGRSVKRADLSPFIKWIPGGNPADFSTAHASGSTSQAANIMEAVESGARTMLIDEDISATNFMIRDAAMKELITREPITPFTERAGELYASCGVSTILVIGGSGEYLSIADSVIMMDSFRPYNATAKAHEIAERRGLRQDTPERTEWRYRRRLKMSSFTTYPPAGGYDTFTGTEALSVSELGYILFGGEKVDIRMLHNIVSPAQLSAAAYILRHIALRCSAMKSIDLDAEIDRTYALLREKGLDEVYTNFFAGPVWLELPRKHEVKAIVSRMRGISFTREENCDIMQKKPI